MAEAFAILGAVASIVQLVDFGSRVLRRLNDFNADLGEVPEAFRNIKVELPLLLKTLQDIQDAIESRLVTDETAEKAVLPVIHGCRVQVESLNTIIDKLLPAPGDARTRRSKKALSSLRKDKNVDQITSTLRGYVQTLTFHYAAAAPTMQALKGTTHPFPQIQHIR